MRGDASEVVYVAVKREVDRAVYWAFDEKVDLAVQQAVERIVEETTYGKVFRAVDCGVCGDIMQLSGEILQTLDELESL